MSRMTTSDDTNTRDAGPTHDLPPDPQRFWQAGEDLCALEAAFAELPSGEPAPTALQRLGAPPFAKSKFPFLGFLASVYDHVATHAKGRAVKE